MEKSKKEIDYNKQDNKEENEYRLLKEKEENEFTLLMEGIENMKLSGHDSYTPIDCNNLFGLREDDLDRVINNFSIFISDIDSYSYLKISHILDKFYFVEKTLDEYLKSLTLLKSEQLRILKLLSNEMLEQKFSETENIFKKSIFSLIDKSYENITKQEIQISNFEYHFEFLKNDPIIDIDIEVLNNTFKEITSTIYTIFLSDLEFILLTSNIPQFILKPYRKKIKQKIKLVCNPLLKDYYHKIIDNKIEVKVLKGFFSSYLTNSLNLFDYDSLNPKLIDNLFNIFILSNIDYFKTDPIALQVFLTNFAKYSLIFNLQKLDNSTEVDSHYYNNKKIDKIMSTYFDLPFDELDDILKLHVEILKETIGEYNEKFFFVIFSFSLLLNNIVKAEDNNIVINDHLICKGRERQFLTNVLKVLKNYFNHHYDAFTINSFCQSIVINNILKAQSEEMYDSCLNMKRVLTISKIEGIITKCECGNREIIQEFKKILSENKSGSVFSNLSLILRSLLEFMRKDNTQIDLSSFNIVPFDSFSLSTNATICISGFTSDGIDQEHAWENITVDLNKYTDFYFLNWPSETKFSFLKDILFFIGSSANNIIQKDYIRLISDAHAYVKTSNAFLKAKRTAKVCGKLLAFILASRAIFKFQTINLVGFSLGTHLIKHCVKQLYALSVKDSRLENIIQNVVFVAGATSFKDKSKWEKIFNTMVSGRIINCHGSNDNILKFLFKITTFNDAIGQKALDMDTTKIENYDFSDLGIDHHEYRKSLPSILKRIKLN